MISDNDVSQKSGSTNSMTYIPDDLDDEQVLVVDGDVKRITQLEADERGRINLGSEYADETVRVAVIDSESDE